MLFNFLVRMLQIIETLFFFAKENIEKETSKARYFSKNEEIFISALAAQTVEFMLSNVAYKPTVYKTGEAVHLNCCCSFLCTLVCNWIFCSKNSISNDVICTLYLEVSSLSVCSSDKQGAKNKAYRISKNSFLHWIVSPLE